MDRIRRISETLLERYPEKFTSDFAENKKVLDELTLIASKALRNRVAGYIAKTLKERTEEKEELTEATAE